MVFLNILFQLERALQFAPHEAPFKGGVLHGCIEHALTQHDPQLWENLRGPSNAPASMGG